MQGVGSVLGLVLGGVLTVISWRLAFLINVPIGIVIIVIAVYRTRRDTPRATQARRHRRAAGHARLHRRRFWCSPGARRARWVDPWVIGAGVAAAVFFVAFLFVERTAEHRSSVLGVRQPQPGDDVRVCCSWPAACC